MRTVTVATIVLAALSIPATAADLELQTEPRHHAVPYRHAPTQSYYHISHRAAYAHHYAAPEPVYSEPAYGFNPFGIVSAALQVPITVLEGTQSIFVPRTPVGATYRPCPC